MDQILLTCCVTSTLIKAAAAQVGNPHPPGKPRYVYMHIYRVPEEFAFFFTFDTEPSSARNPWSVLGFCEIIDVILTLYNTVYPLNNLNQKPKTNALGFGCSEQGIGDALSSRQRTGGRAPQVVFAC